MLDRFGARIHVGYAEHEILWIEAAMTLPLRSYERLAAFRDIASMTGRSLEAIRTKSYMIEGARLDALVANRSAKLFVPAQDMRNARGIETRGFTKRAGAARC